MRWLLFFWLLGFTLFFPNIVFTQETNSNKKLGVYIDCSSTWCDLDYFKTEIKIVDFLRDRLAADVHVLVTSIETGSGGTRYSLIFYGQNRFANLLDTIMFNRSPDATGTEARELMLKYLELGLIPFITKTGLVSGITVNMKQDPSITEIKKTERDSWNYWVITVYTDGNVSGDQTYKSYGFHGNLSANRITEKMKVGASLYGNKSSTTYELEMETGTNRFIAKNSYYGLEHYFVKSISKYWSTGYQAIFTNNTFSNYKRQLYFRTGIEYNIFPYKEVSTRFFTFSYTFIFRFNRYYDTTLYNKLKENTAAHSLASNLALNKKWGSIHAGINYSSFFRDWNLNNLRVNLNVSMRVTGGLSFYISARAGLVHDQIYLPKAGVTEEEVLTRLRQLKSSYYYENRFGISYRFGSKLNNFVNPRFEEY